MLETQWVVETGEYFLKIDEQLFGIVQSNAEEFVGIQLNCGVRAVGEVYAQIFQEVMVWKVHGWFDAMR